MNTLPMPAPASPDYTLEQLEEIIATNTRGYLIACAFLRSKGVNMEGWDRPWIEHSKDVERVDLKMQSRLNCKNYTEEMYGKETRSKDSPSGKIINAVYDYFGK